MAAITKTPSNTWKAIIRKRGWPATIKTFRTKRDAADWARRTEDEMVRGVYINRAGAEKLLLEKALDRYLSEVSASKRESTAYAESHKAKALKKKFGAYSLAAITPDLVAEYRDERLAAGALAGHGHGVAETQGPRLVDDPEVGQVGDGSQSIALVLPSGVGQCRLQFVGGPEVIDHARTDRSGHEHDLVDAGGDGLLDHILNGGAVDDC